MFTHNITIVYFVSHILLDNYKKKENLLTSIEKTEKNTKYLIKSEGNIIVMDKVTVICDLNLPLAGNMWL